LKSKTSINFRDYLKRIRYSEHTFNDHETLCRLQKSHLLRVPFENLDIINRIPIELDIEKIYNKIVTNHRGGFCYELNGLFYQLLTELGFDVRMISARVFDKIRGYGPEFDHLAVLTTIDGTNFLTDVGFGEFTFYPVPLNIGVPHSDPRGDFIIDRWDSTYMRICKNVGGELVPQYIFCERARKLEDFAEMCHYHQTSPASHFTGSRLVTVPTNGGRITLSGDTLKIKTDNSLLVVDIASETQFQEIWSQYFEL